MNLFLMILLLLVGLLIFLILYYLVKAYRLAYLLSHPKRNQFRLKLPENVKFQKFYFQTEDGIQLCGADLIPPGKIKYTLLICHNLGGSKEVALLFYDYLLADGFRLIAFDFRNHGESGAAKSIVYSFDKDFAAFYQVVQKRGIKTPVGIIGLSIGSHTAFYGIDRYPDIQCVLIDSGPLLYPVGYFEYVLNENQIKQPFFRLIFMALFLFHSGFLKLSRDTIRILKKIKGKPVLMIYPDNDHIILERNILKAYQCVESVHSELWKVYRSRHLTNYMIAKQEYQNKVKFFFHKYLK